MKFAGLGRSGLQVSRLSIGTMTFGAQMDEPTAHRLLDQAYEAGVNFFDTAEIYPAPAHADTYGVSETILGRWLQRMPRDRVVISTKLAGAGDRPEGPRLPWVRGGATAVDRSQASTACEASLQRLRTDYIDVYQPHWHDRKTPIDVQLDAMHRLIEQGKVRHFGLSNETAWGVTAFCAASARSKTRPVSVQNAYNLLQRRIEHGLAEACQQEQVSFIAYSPLAMGVLTGKYCGGRRPQQARLSASNRYGEMYLQDRLLAVADSYLTVARTHGLDPVDMAYAWVQQQPIVATVLSSFSRIEQLRPFLHSAQTCLDDATVSALDAVRQTHDARWNTLG
jgi:aryl-alcohol dehydrogenase-like predicted oxidoreductase